MEDMKLIVNAVKPEIKANFEEIEKWIESKTHEYDGVVFTEDQKTAAKKSVTDLRKSKKSVEDTLKETKKRWLEPYEIFADKVKVLSTKFDVPIDYINAQVDAFESKRIEQRETDIKELYDASIGDMAGFLPLHMIKSEKWTNASVNLKTIGKEMADSISSARAGKTAIECMNSDAKESALNLFKSTLDLPKTLDYVNRYEVQKAEILKREEANRKAEEERKLQAEIERAKADERRKIADEERIRREAEAATRAEVNEEIFHVNEVDAAPLTMPESIKAVYTVVGTDAELQELEMAMNSLGLYFERKDI